MTFQLDLLSGLQWKSQRFNFPDIQYLFGAWKLSKPFSLLLKTLFLWSWGTPLPTTQIVWEKICHHILKQINQCFFEIATFFSCLIFIQSTQFFSVVVQIYKIPANDELTVFDEANNFFLKPISWKLTKCLFVSLLNTERNTFNTFMQLIISNNAWKNRVKWIKTTQ